MAAGLFIFVLALLSWNAESQFLPETGFQPNIVSPSSCGCPAKQYLPLSEPIGSNCRPCLLNTKSQCDISSTLGSFESQCVCGLPSQLCVPPTGCFASNLGTSVLYNTDPKCDYIRSNLVPFGKECGCGSSQFLGPLSPTLRSNELQNSRSQCECSSPFGEFNTGPGKLIQNNNSPANFPSISSCNNQSPSYISNCPNNFANQVTETITTQVPSTPGRKQFVSETFVTKNPCQSSSYLNRIGLPPTLSNIAQYNSDKVCAAPVIETCIRTEDDDELLSATLANALQLLILSNLIENLNDATALGTFSSPQPCCNVIENLSVCKEPITPVQSVLTGCSNKPSLPLLSSVGSLCSNPFGPPRQVSCNTRLTEPINPIRVPPCTFGGVPEIVSSKICSNAPNIPDVINPTNLKIAEAINSRLPFGPIPSYNRNFADSINPINLPYLVQPSVLPEIGNPVNLPKLISRFPNKEEFNPFQVQSFSPLAPTPGLVAYNTINGPLQVPEPFNYNQFDGPFIPDVSNYNGPLLPDAFNFNQFNEPSNPLIAILEQILLQKSNGYVTPYGSSDTYNPYSSYGGYSDQNPLGGTYGCPSEMFNQYGFNYPVSTTSPLLDTFSSQNSIGTTEGILAPIFSALGRPSYAENLEGSLPISLLSTNYPSELFSQTSSSSFNNGFIDVSSSTNPYSYPEIVFLPVDIPGIPVALSGQLPDVSFSVTPSNSFCESKDVPPQIMVEPIMAELVIPSAIPATLTVSF